MGTTSDPEHRELVSSILDRLGEETMRLAWGEGTTAEERRRIVSAAVIFGRQFEERVAARSADEEQARRLLMDLMNGVVGEFAGREGMRVDDAAEFIGEVGRRDRILEFSEVLDAHEASGEPLDDLLRRAVNGREERASRSRPGRA